MHNKKSNRWTVVPYKTEKQYNYIPSLIRKSIQLRLEDRVGMQRRVVLSPHDPRVVSGNIAPTQPPSTAELVAQKVSRL